MDGTRERTSCVFVGQVEQDPAGDLWAVLYASRSTGDCVMGREPVRSVKHGRRRVGDMLLARADAMNVLAGTAHR